MAQTVLSSYSTQNENLYDLLTGVLLRHQSAVELWRSRVMCILSSTSSPLQRCNDGWSMCLPSIDYNRIYLNQTNMVHRHTHTHTHAHNKHAQIKRKTNKQAVHISITGNTNDRSNCPTAVTRMSSEMCSLSEKLILELCSI